MNRRQDRSANCHDPGGPQKLAPTANVLLRCGQPIDDRTMAVCPKEFALEDVADEEWDAFYAALAEA